MAEGQPAEVIGSDDGVPDTIPTEEVALAGILRNLLSNGIKYTDHGEMRLGARVMGPRLETTASDTGIGIPGAEVGAFTNHLMSVFGPREDDRGDDRAPAGLTP